MKVKRLIIITIASFLIISSCVISKFENTAAEIIKNDAYSMKTTMVHKTLKKDEYNIHYYVSDKKNTDLIIFLHPAFSDHRAFDQQIDFFSKNYTVITIDLIGHGLSKAKKSNDKIDISIEYINEIIETEKFNKAHLIGVSMGSLIAQYFALNYPEKTTSLTALGGYNINKENKEIAKAQRLSNLSLILRAIFSMKAFRKKIAKITCETEKGQALFYTSTSYYERKSFMVMQGLQNVIKKRNNIKSTYPTLILTGEYDIELAKKMAKNWHSEIDNSKSLIIKNAGHCANMDKPLEFNKIIEEFISEN